MIWNIENRNFNFCATAFGGITAGHYARQISRAARVSAHIAWADGIDGGD